MVGVAPLAGAGSVGPKRIRPRPLDIYKSIAIIRSEGEDDNGSTRGGDAGPKTETLANVSGGEIVLWYGTYVLWYVCLLWGM
jgi:hypothetical protein